jgi:rhodanese-related sulfurtransferase
MFNVKEISAGELAEQLETKRAKLRLIDTRTPAETSQGIIPGAELIPMHLIPLHVAHWHNEKRTIVVYCHTGLRSAQLCAYLAARGDAPDVVNLRGGIMDWARAGQALGLPRQAMVRG